MALPEMNALLDPETGLPVPDVDPNTGLPVVQDPSTGTVIQDPVAMGPSQPFRADPAPSVNVNVGQKQSYDKTTDGTESFVPGPTTQPIVDDLVASRKRMNEQRAAVVADETNVKKADASADAQEAEAKATAQTEKLRQVNEAFEQRRKNLESAEQEIAAAKRTAESAFAKSQRGWWEDQNTPTKVLAIVARASAYDDWVLGRVGAGGQGTPGSSPFERIESLIEDDKAKKMANYLKSKEYLAEVRLGPQRAQEAFDRQKAAIEAQSAVAMDVLASQAESLRKNARNNPEAIGRAQDFLRERAQQADDNAHLNTLRIYDEKKKKEGERQTVAASGNEDGWHSGKLTETEAKAGANSTAIVRAAAAMKGKSMTDDTLSKMMFNARTALQPGGAFSEWLKKENLSPFPSTLVDGITDPVQKELARNAFLIAYHRLRHDSGGAIVSPEKIEAGSLFLPTVGDGPEQQEKLRVENMRTAMGIMPRNRMYKRDYDQAAADVDPGYQSSPTESPSPQPKDAKKPSATKGKSVDQIKLYGKASVEEFGDDERLTRLIKSAEAKKGNSPEIKKQYEELTKERARRLGLKKR